MTCDMVHLAAGFYVWLFTSMLLDGPAAACWRLIGLPLQVGGPEQAQSLAHHHGPSHASITVWAPKACTAPAISQQPMGIQQVPQQQLM